jgi:V-type H+-transporting ATPase subunit d
LDFSTYGSLRVLVDARLHLQQTDYGDFLANEPSPLAVTTVAEKCTERLVEEFEHLRCQASEPLSTFLTYITYGYMIDNIVLLITGTLHERETEELLEKCHPLGWFDGMRALSAAQSVQELYDMVLVDTPLASYFKDCFVDGYLDDTNIEIVRNVLYKAYLEDFYKYCQSLGGATSEIMSEILEFEADRRAINITINSFNTEMTKQQRLALYPAFGKLWPAGTRALERCDDVDQVRAVVEAHNGRYGMLFADSVASWQGGEDTGNPNESKSLEDAFFEMEVKMNQLSFDQLMQFAVFFSYVRLKEQEIRNIVWICECVSQKMRDKVNNYIPIFKDY